MLDVFGRQHPFALSWPGLAGLGELSTLSVWIRR